MGRGVTLVGPPGSRSVGQGVGSHSSYSPKPKPKAPGVRLAEEVT